MNRLQASTRFPVRTLSLAITATLANSVIVVAPAVAQSLVLEEVIVTARKREESLQRTPVAVTALGQDALRDLGVRNLKDLNNVVPNVEVQDVNGSSGIANIYIRGVGQRNSGANIDSGVGLYIDGVYLGRADGALLDLNDTAQVQVLRGPQGTLFGKNTTGGALLFTTNRPSDELEGNVQVRVGNLDRQDISGVLNVPITDGLATRLSVSSVERDGYVENVFDGNDYADEDRINAIWQLRWQPSDELMLDLNANYAETDQLAKPLRCEVVPGAEGWQSSLLNDLAIVPSTGRTAEEFCADAQALDTDKAVADIKATYESENKGVSLTAEWAATDSVSLKSITALRNTKAGENIDLDHSGIPFLSRTYSGRQGQRLRDTDQFSQELEISGSALDDRLQYVSGVFWFQEETNDDLSVGYLGPFEPTDTGLLYLNAPGTLIDSDNEAWAVFSQVEWSFSEQWTLTAGIRYTDETREFSSQPLELDPSTLDLNGGMVNAIPGGINLVDPMTFELNPDFALLPPNPANLRQGKVSNDDVSPMASIQYLLPPSDWIGEGTVYLTYAEGFLSGGLSEGPSPELQEFEPEEVTNWELGVKLDLFDRRLRLNTALFHSEYDNRQLTSLRVNPDTGALAAATINAEESTITGLEIEATFLVTENFSARLNATFNDGDIDEFTDVQLAIPDGGPVADNCELVNIGTVLEQCVIDRSNEDLPRLPKEIYFLAFDYLIATEYGAVMPHIQASLKTDVEYCISNIGCTSGQWREDEQFDLSARVTWVSADERWIAALYGNNLTDEDYVTGATDFSEVFGTGGLGYAIPRTYGVELQYNF